MKKYALHPGYITSISDGDTHFITAQQLITLYDVNPKDCILWSPYGLNKNDYVHLFPDPQGRYALIK